MPFLRCYGRNAVALLLADPGARPVKRGTLTSLVKFSDETYCVLRNEHIHAANGDEHNVISTSHGSELQHRLAMHQIQHIGLRHQLMSEVTQPRPPSVPLPPWRQAQLDALAAAPAPATPWTLPTPIAAHADPDCEPVPASNSRPRHRTVYIRAIDPDHLLRHEPELPRFARLPEPDGETSEDDSPMEHYASPKPRSRRSNHLNRVKHYASSASSFRGGTAVNAFCSVRDPHSDDPFATRSILVGLDSYSDITVVHRDIVYGMRPIEETVYTGAGAATYTEEGFVDIVDGLYPFRTIPALVGQTPDHLPSSTYLLLGVPQLNELDIKCDVHRKTLRLPLQSYDESSDFAFDVSLQHRLAEKDLQALGRLQSSIQSRERQILAP